MAGTETFDFDFGARMVQLSDGELLEGLKRFAERVGGRAFRIKEFNAWRDRPFAANTAIKRFGSWRRALAMVGVEGGRGRQYEAAELIKNLEDVWRELGRRPGARYLARRGKFSAATYRSRWGSVREACKMLARHHRGKITREELLRGVPTVNRRKGVAVHVRWVVLKRDRYRCVLCGASPAVDTTVALEVDHVVPVSAGGANREENLRTLCRACNAGKGAGGGIPGAGGELARDSESSVHPPSGIPECTNSHKVL